MLETLLLMSLDESGWQRPLLESYNDDKQTDLKSTKGCSVFQLKFHCFHIQTRWWLELQLRRGLLFSGKELKHCCNIRATKNAPIVQLDDLKQCLV